MSTNDNRGSHDQLPYLFMGEGAIVASSGDVFSLPPAALYGLEPAEEAMLSRCNIYAITSSPRLSVQECSLVSPDRWRIRWLRSTTPAETIDLEIDTTELVAKAADAHTYQSADIRLQANHSGSELHLLDGDSTLIYGLTAAEALAYIANLIGIFPDVAVYFDQTVEYIGQAVGRSTPRSAVQRLRSHETLQRILAELQQRQPNMAVLLVLFEFRAQDNMIVITPDDAVADLDSSAAYAKRIWQAKVDVPQLTTLAEASMIRYFQPPYNKEYRFTFPREGQSSYSTYYELEANSVGFYLSTRGTGRRLCRGGQAGQWEHSAMFALRGETDRRSLKDVFSGPGLQDFYVDPN